MIAGYSTAELVRDHLDALREERLSADKRAQAIIDEQLAFYEPELERLQEIERARLEHFAKSAPGRRVRDGSALVYY